MCRQNVTHSVLCRKSIWRPFPIQGSPATVHNPIAGRLRRARTFIHSASRSFIGGGNYG
nr:MAG TPA: hypothetical protein [Caudoviricetes sp.]